MYKVILKDDRGTDTSTLNLTDQGNPAESVHHLITAANMSRNMIKSCSLVGFKDLMNEVFSYIGKRLNDISLFYAQIWCLIHF